MTARHSEFGIVPTGAILDPEVSRNDFWLLALLSTYADKDGYCWPGLGSLAEQSHMTKPGVSKALHRLETAGWLRIIQRHRDNGSQTTNGYYVQRHKRGVVPDPSLPPEEPENSVNGGSSQTGSEESQDQPGKKFTGDKLHGVNPRTYQYKQTNKSSSRDFADAQSLSEQLSSEQRLTVQEKAHALREHNEMLPHRLRVGYVTDLLLGGPETPKPNVKQFVSRIGGMGPLYKFIAYMLTQFPLDFLVDWFVSLKAVPWKPEVTDWRKYLFGAAGRQYEQWKIDQEEARHQKELESGENLPPEVLQALQGKIVGPLP